MLDENGEGEKTYNLMVSPFVGIFFASGDSALPTQMTIFAPYD
jgi:hypothetical protein